MPVAACSLYQAPRCRYSPVHVPNLVVQSQEGHWRVNGLPALGTEAYNLQSCLVDLLCELVHGDVTWGTDQHRPAEWSGLSASPRDAQQRPTVELHSSDSSRCSHAQAEQVVSCPLLSNHHLNAAPTLLFM